MTRIEIPLPDDFPYKDDVLRLQRVLSERGYEASDRTAADLWDRYSDSMAAGWMSMDGETDDTIWGCVSLDVLQLTHKD
jgi:hypothetical protein